MIRVFFVMRAVANTPNPSIFDFRRSIMCVAPIVTWDAAIAEAQLRAERLAAGKAMAEQAFDEQAATEPPPLPFDGPPRSGPKSRKSTETA